jgi:hypothetical protein
MFTQPPRNVETSINSIGHTKVPSDDISVPIQRWTYQGQYSSSFSSHKCPHTFPINGNQGVFERWIGEPEGTIREYLEGKPYCFECALIMHLVEDILPGWAQRNPDNGKVRGSLEELRPPFSMSVVNKEGYHGSILFLLKPTSKGPCTSIAPMLLCFSKGSLTDL